MNMIPDLDGLPFMLKLRLFFVQVVLSTTSSFLFSIIIPYNWIPCCGFLMSVFKDVYIFDWAKYWSIWVCCHAGLVYSS